MRFVVVGLGAVGGTVAARLSVSGHAVIGVARGPHGRASSTNGLRLETPDATTTANIEIHGDLREIPLDDVDAVIVAVKSQDMATVLAGLARFAPADTPILCMQNGVTNEPAALQCFTNVYGVVVVLPAEHLEPGLVRAFSAPVIGLLDVGRYPSGEDALSRTMAEVLTQAGFDSRSIADVSRWKYAKLLTNLGNAVEVICGPAARPGVLTRHLQDEARRLFDHAHVDHASASEESARRSTLLNVLPVAGGHRSGGSMWQSVSRHRSGTEVDHLNGEICRLGRLHGMETPANALVRDLTWRVFNGEVEPGSISEDAVLAQLSSP